MSAVLSPKPATQAPDVNLKLNFQKNLQTVTNRIHATSNVDEIMLEVSQEICNLFNADRLTLYAMGEDKASIISKIKTGLNSFKDLKLPIAEQSIAGYVALSKKIVNLKDVNGVRALETVYDTMTCLLKTREDKARMTREVTSRLLAKVA